MTERVTFAIGAVLTAIVIGAMATVAVLDPILLLIALVGVVAWAACALGGQWFSGLWQSHHERPNG